MPRTKTAYDVEEITPNHFIVHNANAYSVLRTEGERRGTLFELTTWRREGLLARLAARGYRTLTLEGRLESLPTLPEPQPLGKPTWRPLGTPNERYSVFDPQLRDWRALEQVEQGGIAGVELQAGQAIRRRKGRGAADYYRALAERNGRVELHAVDETTALLAGYAQTNEARHVTVAREADVWLVPPLQLPQSYREFLRRVAEETRIGWRVDERGWPYAVRLFERLGLELHPE